MIGEQIKQARELRKMSKAELARQCSISRTWMSLIESGKTPSGEVLERICDALNYELRMIPKI